MDELGHDKRQLCRDRKYQEGNTSQLRQVFLYCDKVLKTKPAQEGFSIATQKTLSRHSILSLQHRRQNFGRDKDKPCCDKLNMRRVNYMSQQDFEEQHKKNGDREVYVVT